MPSILTVVEAEGLQNHRHPVQPSHDRRGDDRRAEREAAVESQNAYAAEGEDKGGIPDVKIYPIIPQSEMFVSTALSKAVGRMCGQDRKYKVRGGWTFDFNQIFDFNVMTLGRLVSMRIDLSWVIPFSAGT